MHYDVVSGSSKRTLPTVQRTIVAARVMKPDTSIEVLVTSKSGYEKESGWFGVRTSDKCIRSRD